MHYLINDMFMVLFFGIATKEVTESCLPGGSLNPPRKALAPLVATVGGVSGPVIVYILSTFIMYETGAFNGYETWVSTAESSNSSASMASMASSSGSVPVGPGYYIPTPYSTVMRGWGIPTATDISLAWVVAAQVFPLRHPAIDFLLLLAVADDAIGLVIIAVFYTDPDFLPQPPWLLLCLGAMAIALTLRVVLRLQHWAWYIMLAGVPSWIGLSLARLHPALALVFVVPFLPSQPPKARPNQMPTLHAFEHALKAPVDWGLFLFTLANAGVNLAGGGGPLALCVVGALIVGKLLGVTILVFTASKLNLAPVNSKIKSGDVAMIASMASVGLTVALFVAGVAFKNDPRLQGEAKFGALLSGLMGGVCIAISKLSCWKGKKVDRPSSPIRGEVPNHKLRAAIFTVDSFILRDEPAAQSLGYRQSDFYKHAIRAGENRMANHPDQLQKPTFFAVDPDASLRARAKWKLARGTSTIVPLGALNDEERAEVRMNSTIKFLQRQSSGSKSSKLGLAVANTAADAAEPSQPAAEPSQPVVEPSQPVVEDVDSEPSAAAAQDAS